MVFWILSLGFLTVMIPKLFGYRARAFGNESAMFCILILGFLDTELWLLIDMDLKFCGY